MTVESEAPARPIILLVDDDTTFTWTLSCALERRGYATRLAIDVESGLAAARAEVPDYAVIDLRLPGGSGLLLVKQIQALAPEVRIVVLTGFGSIATTVDAIKLGAHHYLTKPANADEVLAALLSDAPSTDVDEPQAEAVTSVRDVQWEHIHRVLAQHNGNITATARLLGIHRRTLQRKLNKTA